MSMNIKPADLTHITKSVGAAVRMAITEYMSATRIKEIVSKVNSSQINHTDLQPEGHVFTIQVVVELHEKTE